MTVTEDCPCCGREAAVLVEIWTAMLVCRACARRLCDRSVAQPDKPERELETWRKGTDELRERAPVEDR